MLIENAQVVPVTRLRFVSYDTTLAEDIKTKFEANQGARRRSQRKSATTAKRGETSTQTQPGPSVLLAPGVSSVAIAHFDPESCSISVGPTMYTRIGGHSGGEHGEGPNVEGDGLFVG